MDAYYTDHLTTIHNALAHVRCWPDSARKAALIAQYEEEIAQFEECQAIAAEMAEVASDEVSAELDAAITTAQAVGCVVVADAPALLSELARIVPGCVALRGSLTVASVSLDGGELRLVRRAASATGAMSWFKR
jgi:hypothetical protein